MKKLLILFCTVVLTACSTEEKEYKQESAFRNTSDYPVHLLVIGNIENLNKNDTLINAVLAKGESSVVFSYYNKSFIGFIHFNYIRIQFLNNNKGYICSFDENKNLCFTKRISPLLATSSEFVLESGIYHYEITQEDYENAHVLP